MREKISTSFETDTTRHSIPPGEEKTRLSPLAEQRGAKEKGELGMRTSKEYLPESGERRESLPEISEVLRNVDRLTVEMYDARIAGAGSAEEMQEILRDLNHLQELREAELCKPPCKAIGAMEEQGESKAYRMRLAERGREVGGVYKPSLEEDPMTLKVGIEDNSFYLRAWLSFMVDRAFELGVVRPTILRDEEKGIGAVQTFIENFDPSVKVPERKKNPEDLFKIALLHLITGQQDGHRGNILVDRTPRGGVEAIDLGVSFGAALHDENGEEVSPALLTFSTTLEEAKDISEAIQTPLMEIHLKTFLDSPARQEALRKAFDFVLRGEAGGVWNAFMETVQELSGKKELPRDYDIVAADKEMREAALIEYGGTAKTRGRMAAAA